MCGFFSFLCACYCVCSKGFGTLGYNYSFTYFKTMTHLLLVNLVLYVMAAMDKG